jgi:hypothetical protein
MIAPDSELMIAVRFLLLALTLVATSTFGGEIYGTIKEADQPAKGASVEVKIGNKTYSAIADEFGNYRVVVTETGTCRLTIHLKDQSIIGEVQSYWNPSRFDWVIEKSGDKYSLKRQ